MQDGNGCRGSNASPARAASVLVHNDENAVGANLGEPHAEQTTRRSSAGLAGPCGLLESTRLGPGRGDPCSGHAGAGTGGGIIIATPTETLCERITAITVNTIIFDDHDEAAENGDATAYVTGGISPELRAVPAQIMKTS